MKYFSLINKDTVHPATNAKVIPSEEFSELLNAVEVLNKAKEDVKEFLKENKEECERRAIAAEEKGYNQGLIEFNKQLLVLDKHIKQMRHELQQSVLPIALKAAKKIVGGELRSHPDSIVSIVMQALKPVTQNHLIKIIICKEGKLILDEKKEEIRNILDQVESFSIVEREDISQGDCIIETEAGIINASLDNQWRALEAAFEAFMKR